MCLTSDPTVNGMALYATSEDRDWDLIIPIPPELTREQSGNLGSINHYLNKLMSFIESLPPSFIRVEKLNLDSDHC